MPLDQQIVAALAALEAARGGQPFVAPQDVETLREQTNVGLAVAFARLPDAPNVDARDFLVTGADGGEVAVRWYERRGAAGGPAVVYAHGGGMVCGSLGIYDRLSRYYVELSGVPMLAVDYRLAPEFRGVGLGRDVMKAIEWLVSQARSLDVDARRIAVMGDSGGGGLAAAAAVMARDHGIALVRQILVYPMLDDRNVVEGDHGASAAFWSVQSNRLSWGAVLGSDFGAADVSPYEAPARLSDFSDLAPAYIEVGELDLFRDEAIAYAKQMYSAGVSCELRVHSGAPHGYDIMNIDFDVSRRAMADRIRVLQAL
jgi:acetyl esterase/lipase